MFANKKIEIVKVRSGGDGMGGGYEVSDTVLTIRANVSSYKTRDHVFKDSGYLTDNNFLVLTKDNRVRKLRHRVDFNYVRVDGELFPVLAMNNVKKMSSLIIQRRQGNPL